MIAVEGGIWKSPRVCPQTPGVDVQFSASFHHSAPNSREGAQPSLTAMPQCPLLAISGHSEGSSRTSALPPKADIQAAIPRQPLSNVRFALNSGHKWLWCGMSAFDPLQTLPSSRTAPRLSHILQGSIANRPPAHALGALRDSAILLTSRNDAAWQRVIGSKRRRCCDDA